MEVDFNCKEILWDICQDFRDRTDIKKGYLEYISALLYIAYFEDEGNLRKLYSRRNKYYIGEEIDQFLKKIREKNKNLFRNIKFEDIRIHRDIGEENILSKTIKNLYELISNLKWKEGKLEIAEAYRRIIIRSINNWELTSRNGEIYTPKGIAKIMTKIAIQKKESAICDMFCGAGNILLNVPLNENHIMYGREENLGVYNICMTNLLLHDIDNTKVELEESLFSFPNKEYDCIISNPPFMERGVRYRELYNQKIYDIIDDHIVTPGDYGYVLKMFKYLKKDGKMAVILPHGVLFRESEKKVREEFIKNNYIDAIIGLPENIFLGTRNSVIIMVLKKNKKDKNILFIDASKECEHKKNINIIQESNQEKIINTYSKREEIKEFSHLASFSEITKNDFKLTIKRYVSKEVVKIKVKKDEIIDSLEKLEKEKNILENNIKDVLERLSIDNIFKK